MKAGPGTIGVHINGYVTAAGIGLLERWQRRSLANWRGPAMLGDELRVDIGSTAGLPIRIKDRPVGGCSVREIAGSRRVGICGGKAISAPAPPAPMK